MAERFLVAKSQDIDTKCQELHLVDRDTGQTVLQVEQRHGSNYDFYDIYWHTEITPGDFLKKVDALVGKLSESNVGIEIKDRPNGESRYMLDGNEYADALRPYTTDGLPEIAYRDGNLEYIGVITPYGSFAYSNRGWDHRAGKIREMRDADKPLISIQGELSFPDHLATFIQENGRSDIAAKHLSEMLSKANRTKAA